jgi:hypothetical protein
MGNCISAQDRADKAISDAIDKQIEEDSRKFRKECKILLLGKTAPLIYLPSIGAFRMLAALLAISLRGHCKRYANESAALYCM